MTSKIIQQNKDVNFVKTIQANDLDLAKDWLEDGANINAIIEGKTPLTVAAYEGKTEAVEFLLKSGANQLIGNSWGNTPLMLATVKGYENIVDLLLQEAKESGKLDKLIDMQHIYGPNALHLLAEHGKDRAAQADIAIKLLEAGIDYDAETTHQYGKSPYVVPVGSTPLDVAEIFGNHEIESLISEYIDHHNIQLENTLNVTGEVYNLVADNLN